VPRQIIDTQSSRPAYRRRLAIRWVIILVLFIAAVLAGVRIWQVTRPRMAAGAALIPGKAALVGKQAPVPRFRRKDAA
jgi:hypothetical protein